MTFPLFLIFLSIFFKLAYLSVGVPGRPTYMFLSYFPERKGTLQTHMLVRKMLGNVAVK